MRRLRNMLLAVVGATLLAAVAAEVFVDKGAIAQTAGTQVMQAFNPGASITVFPSAARSGANSPGTAFNSADQTNNFGRRGVACVLQQTAHTSSPSTTWVIQGKDVASASYYTIGTQGTAVTGTDATAGTSQSVFWLFPGAAVTSNASNNAQLPRIWRVVVTIVGGSSTATQSVGCDYLP